MRGNGSRASAQDRAAWWPPAELLVAPVLVLVLLSALTPTAGLTPNQTDVIAYFQRAESVVRGGTPYRDFAFEYPPLALLSMVLPYVAWPFSRPDLDGYRWLFTAWECLLLVVLVLVTTRIADQLSRDGSPRDPPSSARIVATRLLLLVIVTAPTLIWRYDLLPALLAAIALLLAIERRAALSGVALGLAILAKVYPLFLLPALGAAWLLPNPWRRLGAFGLAIALTLVAVMVPLFLLVGEDAWSFVTYQADRGLQIETLPAGIIMLVSGLSGQRVPVSYDFGAVQVAGASAQAFLAVQFSLTMVGFAALAAVGIGFARRSQLAYGSPQAQPIVAVATACILLLLVTGKVFSVQYIVWLLPMAALLPRRQFWLAVLIGALSVGIHPLFYQQLVNQDLAVILLLNVRNGLVLGLLAWVVVGLRRAAGLSNLRSAVPARA